MIIWANKKIEYLFWSQFYNVYKAFFMLFFCFLIILNLGTSFCVLKSRYWSQKQLIKIPELRFQGNSSYNHHNCRGFGSKNVEGFLVFQVFTSVQLVLCHITGIFKESFQLIWLQTSKLIWSIWVSWVQFWSKNDKNNHFKGFTSVLHILKVTSAIKLFFVIKQHLMCN